MLDVLPKNNILLSSDRDSCSFLSLPLFPSYYLSNDPNPFLFVLFCSTQFRIFLFLSDKYSSCLLIRSQEFSFPRFWRMSYSPRRWLTERKEISPHTSPTLSLSWLTSRKEWHSGEEGQGQTFLASVSFCVKWGSQIWWSWPQLIYDPKEKYFVPNNPSSTLDT